MTLRMARLVTLLGLVLVLALAPTGLAGASSHQYESGFITCADPQYRAEIQSMATGTVAHYMNGDLFGTWNNGSTYFHRRSLTSHWRGTWEVHTTGHISDARAVCPI